MARGLLALDSMERRRPRPAQVSLCPLAGSGTYHLLHPSRGRDVVRGLPSTRCVAPAPAQAPAAPAATTVALTPGREGNAKVSSAPLLWQPPAPPATFEPPRRPLTWLFGLAGTLAALVAILAVALGSR